ncbi:MAG: hypothetical protein IKX94_06455, partial [Muribaculaceae bacterium]|nr:hypothetical protein [Muribaculaceae bacterium]
MEAKRFLSLVLVGTLGVSAMTAQSYYDDDLYAPKQSSKTTKSTVTPTIGTSYSSGYYYETPRHTGDYASADSYYFDSGSTRDVDEYNRRYVSTVTPLDSASLDSALYDDFTYTRRIEKFYNPDIVSGSGDQALIDYYSAPQINVYVDNDPFWWGYNWRWGSLYWGYPYYGYYSPFYWDYPYYWGWGWGWSYPWRPGW